MLVRPCHKIPSSFVGGFSLRRPGLITCVVPVEFMAYAMGWLISKHFGFLLSITSVLHTHVTRHVVLYNGLIGSRRTMELRDYHPTSLYPEFNLKVIRCPIMRVRFEPRGNHTCTLHVSFLSTALVHIWSSIVGPFVGKN
jgi:hypothetical protein